MADSGPLPGPCTRTCTRRTPSPSASRAAASAATVAANGVDFLEPLKPALPDDAHATALPCESVIVTIVLLNVALTWATPSASTTRFAFLVPFAVAITSSPSSSRRWRGAVPSSCARSYECADREPAAHGDVLRRDRNRYPSGA